MTSSISTPAGREGGRGDGGRGSAKGTEARKGWFSRGPGPQSPPAPPALLPGVSPAPAPLWRQSPALGPEEARGAGPQSSLAPATRPTIRRSHTLPLASKAGSRPRVLSMLCCGLGPRTPPPGRLLGTGRGLGAGASLLSRQP